MVKRVELVEILEKAAQHLRDYEAKLESSYNYDWQIEPITLLIEKIDQVTLDLGGIHVPDVF